MSQLLASGAGEQDILDYLAEYVPASIHLCDSDKNIIFTSQSEEFRSEMAIADRISLPIMCMGRYAAIWKLQPTVISMKIWKGF